MVCALDLNWWCELMWPSSHNVFLQCSSLGCNIFISDWFPASTSYRRSSISIWMQVPCWSRPCKFCSHLNDLIIIGILIMIDIHAGFSFLMLKKKKLSGRQKEKLLLKISEVASYNLFHTVFLFNNQYSSIYVSWLVLFPPVRCQNRYKQYHISG